MPQCTIDSITWYTISLSDSTQTNKKEQHFLIIIIRRIVVKIMIKSMIQCIDTL